MNSRFPDSRAPCNRPHYPGVFTFDLYMLMQGVGILDMDSSLNEIQLAMAFSGVSGMEHRFSLGKSRVYLKASEEREIRLQASKLRVAKGV